MNLLRKSSWQKILRAHRMSLVIILILFILFIIRSGSLTAALAVGGALFFAFFIHIGSGYRQQASNDFGKDEQGSVGNLPERP